MREARLLWVIVCAALAVLVGPAFASGEAVERFVDFDAEIDGDGSLIAPWNTLVGKPIEGAPEVTLWLQGEANPSQIPREIAATAPGVESLRVLSRHLVDSTAERAHLSRSYRVEDLPMIPQGNGVFRVDMPLTGDTPVTVLRGWVLPDARPIPATGLDPGLAFDPAYADSFRVAELLRVALRDRGTPNDLASFSDGWAVKGNSVYFKTPTGDAPGTGSEPGYRVVVGNPSYLAFLSFNDFGPNRVPFVEVAGLAVSLQVGKFGMRTLQVNPADSATIRDMLFVACNDNDNVACVNGGGAGDEIRILRNQHLGVGEDGGPIVVSTQAVNDPYDLLVIEDQVTHVGYRLLTIDGNDAGLWRAPRFAIGSFHGGKVLSARVERCIGLSYNNTAIAMFQLPAGLDQIAGLDPRDGDALPVQVRDVWVEGVREMREFNVRGVNVERAYVGPSSYRIVSLFEELPMSRWESCLFEVNARYNALGNVDEYETAFINCIVRVTGDDRAALFGVGNNATGRVFVSDIVAERVGGSAGLRFANIGAGFIDPAFKPGSIVGWDGTPDLGAVLFGQGTLETDPEGLRTPELGGAAADLDAFRAIHGQGVRIAPTGAESLPSGATPSEVAAAYAGEALRPMSDSSVGPMGLNGAGFSGRLGAFQGGHPDACATPDRAAPFGQLTFADLAVFLTLFSSDDPSVDAAEPAGATFADIAAFLNAFNAGCP
jgi:hypothetical protein